MKYSYNKDTDINIAYIGGGSRGYVRTFMTDLALEPSLSGTIRLYDIDVQAVPRRDKQLVYDVFPSVRLVKGRASVVDAKKLVDDMIANTAKYLSNGWYK